MGILILNDEVVKLLTNSPNSLWIISILILGIIFAKLFEIITKKITNSQRASKYVAYIILLFSFLYSLFYYNTAVFNFMKTQFSTNLNLLIEILFIIIIGIIIVNLTIWTIDWLADILNLKEHFINAGLGQEFWVMIEIFIKLILYLIITEIIVGMLNLGSTIINVILLSIAIGTVILFIGLLFYGLKDFFSNWFASLSLKSSGLFKNGQTIITNEANGEIVSINSMATIIDSGKGEYIWIPNSKIASQKVIIKKSGFNLKLLEEFRKNFKSENPIIKYVEMIFEIFDLNWKKIKNVKVENLKDIIKIVKENTKNLIDGLIIPYKSNINLKEETKAWLLEGGFVIFIIHKQALIPGIKKKGKQYVLCVGVEGDNLILMDDSGTYLMNYKDLETAIGKSEEKQYIVFAKKGSDAFLRIKNKLYYSNPDYYKKLNKTSERKLKQMVRKLKEVNLVYPNIIKETAAKYLKVKK